MNSKQQAIQDYLDKNDATEMGRELNALISLQARHALATKSTKFMREFAEHFDCNAIDATFYVVDYMYPRNRDFQSWHELNHYWKLQDERYSTIVKNSAWFKYANA